MICPKCGYEQEERIDCIRCGVVFSKYYALYPKGRPARAEPTGPAPALAAPQRTLEEPEQQDAGQLRHQIRELNRRFAELELERGDQAKLRGDVLQLEQRMLGSLMEMEGRLRDLQQHVEEPPPPVIDELPALREELRQEFAAIHERISGMKLEPIVDRLENLEAREGAAPREAQGSLLELGSVLKEVDALRNSLQNVSLRYSEIGELKKNHLSLSHSLEGIQQELSKGREGTTKESAQKITELEREVSTLRAELRQVLKEIGNTGVSAGMGDLHSLRQEVHSLADSRSSQEQQLKALAELLAVRASEESGRSDLVFQNQIQRMESRFAELESRIPPLPSPGSKSKATDPILELGKVLKEIDGLRSSLQNVTVRYSEIGDLKKNHLILSNSMEGLQRDVAAIVETATRSPLKYQIEALAKQHEASGAEISARIADLETRVADNRIDPKVLVKIQEMDGRFDEIEEKIANLAQEQSRSATNVMQELAIVLKDLDALRGSLQNVTVRYSEIAEVKRNSLTLNERLDVLDAKIAALAAQPAPEPLPPLEADVHAIRENLDDIRRFMSSLSQKL